ncbi:MAG: MCE family protein, partial [Sphingobium sp.]
METRSNHVLVGAVTLLLLAAIMAAAFWFSRLSQGDNKEYDIFFKQSVNGLAKGSGVNYSGVPSGQVEKIELWKRDPSFVKVRISVKDGTPVLQGTTATIAGVGFTGVSEIVLDGAVKGAPPILCPAENITSACPDGVPVIPTKPGALGELLNNAPQLLERLSTLTEKLTELLNDKNQQSIAGILANLDRVTGSLADRSPEI